MNTEMDNLQNADGEQLPKPATTNDSNTESYKTEELTNQEKISDISFKDYETFSFDVLINEAKNLLSKKAIKYKIILAYYNRFLKMMIFFIVS